MSQLIGVSGDGLHAEQFCFLYLLKKHFVDLGFALPAMYFSLLCQRKVHKRKAARISLAPSLLANKSTFGNSLRSNSPRFHLLFTPLLGGDDGALKAELRA